MSCDDGTSTWTEATWQPDPHAADVSHRGGIPWNDPRVRIPRWRSWFRHDHRMQSRWDKDNGAVIGRCRCGANYLRADGVPAGWASRI